MACFTRKQVFLELLNKNNALGISLFDRAAAIARIRNAAAAYCAQPEGQEEEQRTSRNRISIAMQNYIRKAKEFDAFMQQEQKEFEEGRKFLAKIMGRKPEDFTQQDINESIEYLLPSGLHMISARPKLVPPEELYAKRKEAQFDLSGRPYHFLFYTTKQNFSQAMHDCGVHIENLNRMIAKSKTKISPDTKFNMGSSEWKTKTQLEVLFLEKIIDAEYNKFIEAMNVLVHHPLSSQCADFITKFLNVPRAGELTKDLPVPVEISEGVFAVEEKKCRRKRCSGTVTVISPGTGNITINDKELIDAFESVGARNQVLFPLLFTNMLGKVDVKATVSEGGETSQSGTVRIGISKAIRPFVPPEMLLRMMVAGLMHADPRTNERQKPGRRGARARYTWLKR